MLHNYRGHDKLYVVRIDDTGSAYVVLGGWGRATMSKLNVSPKGEFKRTLTGFHRAQSVLANLVNKKVNEGYTRMDMPEYNGGLAVSQVLEKIDTSRIVGLADLIHPTTIAAPTKPATSTKPVRANRQIDI